MKRQDDVFISIIICTHNRADLLKNCVAHLLKQMQSNCELLVINSQSTDGTQGIIDDFGTQIRAIAMDKVGLSHARNAGVAAAAGTHVAFVDDDAYINENFVAEAVYIATHTAHACVGGVYIPWYKYGKPRWYKDAWASNQINENIDENTRIMLMPHHIHASGGVAMYHKKIIMSVGLFDEKLGMNGTKINYGEETELQNKLMAAGYTIGYAPRLIIHHLVPKYKLRVAWHIQSAYSKGRAMCRVRHEKWNFVLICKLFVAGWGGFLIDLIRNSLKLAQKNYYIQNYLLDTILPLAFNLGRLRGFIG